MKAKVAPLPRVNDGTEIFPFVPCETGRKGIVLPVEVPSGSLFHSNGANIVEFYARYSDHGKRIITPRGKDAVGAYGSSKRSSATSPAPRSDYYPSTSQ